MKHHFQRYDIECRVFLFDVLLEFCSFTAAVRAQLVFVRLDLVTCCHAVELPWPFATAVHLGTSSTSIWKG